MNSDFHIYNLFDFFSLNAQLAIMRFTKLDGKEHRMQEKSVKMFV